MVRQITVEQKIDDASAEKLKATFLDESSFDELLTADADVYDTNGKLLLKYRKNIIPVELARLGYESFKKSITWTEGRGTASGGSFKRVRKDGSIANTTVGNFVQSGAVGFMDRNALVHYCRKTAFTHEYFEKFTSGLPFVHKVDELYKELCPAWYAKQRAIADSTNRNYVIKDTAFTTVTVNKNFQTAVHKDAGDFPEGFGNLCVYREGSFEGAYFVLPTYRIGVDMQNGDMLFVDVHKWHGNTGFVNPSEDFLRIAFVMYYREYMYQCKQPKEELERVKMEETGYLNL